MYADISSSMQRGISAAGKFEKGYQSPKFAGRFPFFSLIVVAIINLVP